jgi:hypothetical protein
MDLTDIYSIFHSTGSKYTFFSTAHGEFSKINHVLGHKASINTRKSK